MATKRTLRPKRGGRKQRRKKAARPKDYVTVTSRSYGASLKGVRIYFEGRRPKALQDDGRISFGKHILEQLRAAYGERFRWIITEDTDSIETTYGIVRVRTSQRLLARMNRENWDRTRDIKNEIVRRHLGIAFPGHFNRTVAPAYVAGSLAAMVTPEIIPRLSSDDKEALARFLPEYVAAEASGAVSESYASLLNAMMAH